MKTHLIAGTIAVALLGAAGLVGQTQQETEQPPLTVRLTAAEPGTEVEFKGAYALGNAELQLIEATTPFEVQGAGNLAVAIFETTGSADGWLRAELLREVDGEQKVVAAVSSRRVLLQEDVRGRGARLARSF